MENKMITKDWKILYVRNADYNGTRTIEDGLEIVDYQKNTSIRIWYNDQNYGFDGHWHHALEIILPIENYYDVSTANNNYHLLPGDILIIPPGDLHQLIAPETGSRFIFLFDISVISSLQGFAGIQSLFTEPLHLTKHKQANAYEKSYQLLLNMREEYFSAMAHNDLAIYSKLIQLFVVLGRNRQATYESCSNAQLLRKQEYAQKFNQVLEYIDANYMEDLSLDQVASYSGFSKYHFTRLFKEYTNYTFYDYLTYRRLRVAEGLLSDPTLTVTEIALQAGFTNISSFNRIFKRYKNCTPTQYRSWYIDHGQM